MNGKSVIKLMRLQWIPALESKWTVFNMFVIDDQF